MELWVHKVWNIGDGFSGKSKVLVSDSGMGRKMGRMALQKAVVSVRFSWRERLLRQHLPAQTHRDVAFFNIAGLELSART